MSTSRSSHIPLFKVKLEERGRIRDIKDIVVHVEGLPSCLSGQIVDMGDGVSGIIMGFNEQHVLVLALGDQGRLRMGKEVKGISEPFCIPVGHGFIGRMVSAMGTPCDRGDPVVPDARLPVFRDAPPITHRQPADEFLATGSKLIDAAIPIAKGQRQLFFGDRVTGKTSVLLDTIINQRGTDMVCIYCAIGKSLSAIQKAAAALKEHRALDYTIVMMAPDSAPAGEQYLLPFAAASMGEYFTSQGTDVLVVFDDLTKHAWAYRQLSLLLERPPGREAYPGDIFYVQTQLMERAGRFSKAQGDASMTFLGIAETLQGDLTGYIPSNLASMCDGQVIFSTSLYAEGVRPAIHVGLSLSILGGRVQPMALRELARKVRPQIAHYAELKRLGSLQTGLSSEGERIMKTGIMITCLLQQSERRPVSIAECALLLYGTRLDALRDAEMSTITRFRDNIFAFAREHDEMLLREIQAGCELTAAVEARLMALLRAYLAEAG